MAGADSARQGHGSGGDHHESHGLHSRRKRRAASADLRARASTCFHPRGTRAGGERTLFCVASGAPESRGAVGRWNSCSKPRPMLFNLRNDIGERENLIAQRPDIARRLVALLRSGSVTSPAIGDTENDTARRRALRTRRGVDPAIKGAGRFAA